MLLDVRLPDIDGLLALETIRQKLPDLPVVIFTSYDNPTYVARSSALGASDYVLKGSSRDQILTAIKRAAAGEPAAEETDAASISKANW